MEKDLTRGRKRERGLTGLEKINWTGKSGLHAAEVKDATKKWVGYRASMKYSSGEISFGVVRTHEAPTKIKKKVLRIVQQR